MKYLLNLKKNKIITIDISKKVFYPTETTKLLISNIIKYIKNKKFDTFLDLGCGSGIISLSIIKTCSINKIFASDVSDAAIKSIKKNSKKINNDKIEIKKGSLLMPWKNYKFDIIVNDVSGISSKIAKFSSWFNHVPCMSGIDGTRLTIKVIKKIKKYLNSKGLFFFPIISLSNEKKILDCLKSNKINYKLLEEKFIPAPIKMHENIDVLKRLKKKKLINFKEIYGRIIFSTKIYVAKKN